MVEALYRDGHKEKLICSQTETLVQVVKLAETVYSKSSIKHLKVVPSVNRDRRRVDV